MKGFHAHKAGPAQTGFPSEQYGKVIFDGVTFDTTGGFDVANSTWMPVPLAGVATLIRMSAQTRVVGGAGVPGNPFNPGFVLKPVKFNLLTPSAPYVDIHLTGFGLPDAGLPGVCTIAFSGNAIAEPGDVFYLIQWASAATALTPFPAATLGTLDFDNNSKHHFWCGEF